MTIGACRHFDQLTAMAVRVRLAARTQNRPLSCPRPARRPDFWLGASTVAYDGIRSYRPVIMGRRGAVASNHPLATQAGLLTLQAGGDAVDAAVAIGATLGVVEPFMSGLGGDGFYHVYRKGTGEAVVFNGTGAAPRAATPERYASGIPMS